MYGLWPKIYYKGKTQETLNITFIKSDLKLATTVKLCSITVKANLYQHKNKQHKK